MFTNKERLDSEKRSIAIKKEFVDDIISKFEKASRSFGLDDIEAAASYRSRYDALVAEEQFSNEWFAAMQDLYNEVFYRIRCPRIR